MSQIIKFFAIANTKIDENAIKDRTNQDRKISYTFSTVPSASSSFSGPGGFSAVLVGVGALGVGVGAFCLFGIGDVVGDRLCRLIGSSRLITFPATVFLIESRPKNGF